MSPVQTTGLFGRSPYCYTHLLRYSRVDPGSESCQALVTVKTTSEDVRSDQVGLRTRWPPQSRSHFDGWVKKDEGQREERRPVCGWGPLVRSSKPWFCCFPVDVLFFRRICPWHGEDSFWLLFLVQAGGSSYRPWCVFFTHRPWCGVLCSCASTGIMPDLQTYVGSMSRSLYVLQRWKWVWTPPFL